MTIAEQTISIDEFESAFNQLTKDKHYQNAYDFVTEYFKKAQTQKPTIKLKVSENKSSTLHEVNAINRNRVRIFLNKDYHYGYFVPECFVFQALTPEDQNHYIEKDDFLITPMAANILLVLGSTPYSKPAFFKE